MNEVSRKERTAYVGITVIVAVFWVGSYFLVGALSPFRTPVNVAIGLDSAIPLVPAMVWPYTLCYVVPLVGPLLAPSRADFKRGAWGFVLLSIVCFALFLLFPVKGPRPDKLVIDGWSTWWLSKEYAADTIYNCFPSLHAASAWFFFFVGRRWDTRSTIPLFLVAVGISLGALMVRQHYIADIVMGGVLAWGFYKGAFWNVDKAEVVATKTVLPASQA
jgi:membrane-associated phospholipid phosphatase